MKTYRLFYLFALLFAVSSVTAQNVKTPALRGQIITPATPNPVDVNYPSGNPMNPNGDGFVTLSGSAFNIGGVAEFELPMFGIPKLGGDVPGDNIGDPCGITDLIPDANGFSVYALRDAMNNLIFRFRVGNNNPSVEAWTILLDTDGLFGIGKDPNATADNPGFELDITLIKRNNAGVFVYNIDGTDKCGTPLRNYSTPSHFQISVADEVSCADPDYFYDFYVPFAEVAADFNASSGANLDATTGLRYAAVTNTSATCAMDGKLADISGVDNDDPRYSSCTSCAFVDLIEAQCTTPVQDLDSGDVGFNTQLPFTPTINPVKAGATAISGTVFSTLDPPVPAANIDNIYVLVKIYSDAGVLRDSLVALVTNGTWSANLTDPEKLEAYDVIRARTQLNPEGTGCGTGSGTEVIFKVLVVPDLTFQTNEDTNLDATLVGDGADLGLNPIFTLVSGAGPLNGTVTVNPNGTFTYVPNQNFNGTDTFKYKLCAEIDGEGDPECGEALVTINIIPVNDAPVANDDVFVTLEETPLNATVSGNDVNIDGPQSNYTLVSGPADGILTFNANGTFTYTPGLDFIGTDQFVYSLCDGATPDLCDQATVQITVNDANDAPVANDDTFTINEDEVLSNTLNTNDNPTDGPQNNYTKVSDPLHGTVVVNLNGTFTYTPTSNYFGTDQFTYSLCDGASPNLCDVATVTITINALNDAPIANDDAFIIDENQVLSNTVTANDPIDVDGPVSNYTLVASTGPAHGILVFNPDGTFTYTPTSNFSGTDQFIYSRCDGATPDLCDQATVTITINSINSAPIANDDTFTIDEEEVLTNTVATNDNPTDGPSAIYAKVSDPAHGTVIVNADGTFTYTPDPNYSSGTDQFTYSICDGATPNLCDQATVTITINPINDPPVITGSLSQTTYVLGGVTIDNTLQVTDIDDTNLTGVVVSISNNFSAGDQLIFTNQGGITGSYNAATGVLTLTGNASLAAYTAAIASIKFQNDGVIVLTRRITFIANDGDANSLPWNSFIDYPGNNGGPVLNNDTFVTNEDVPLVACLDVSDPDGDDVVISSFTNVSGNNGVFTLDGGVCFTFTPNPEFHGTVTATVTLCDLGVPQICTPYTITINVLDINDAPVANNQTVIVQEDTETPITLTGSDAEGATLTYSVVDQPVHGTLSCLNCPNPIYKPFDNYTGPDSFTFRVNDGTSNSNIATVSISVVPLNDPPVAVNDILITTMEDVAVTFKITTNDTDPDGNGTINPATIDLDPTTPAEDKTFTVVGEGTYTVDNLGNVTFTPALNYNGTATPVSYTVKDNAGALSNAAPIQVIVTPVNDAPIVTPLTITIDEDQVTTICFTVTDVENDPLVFAGGISMTGNGSLVLDPATGQYCFIYTPKSNYFGQDMVEVTVCDANAPGLCGTGVITININSVNDPPTSLFNGVGGNKLQVTTPEDTPVSFCFDVADEEGNVISVGDLTQVSGGGTLVSGTNAANQLCFTFTPASNFTGTAVWDINICDDGNPVACGKLILEVTVTPVNDAPVAVDQSVTVVEDTPTPITLDVTDVDGDVLTYTIITNPTHGTLTVVGSVITYTPNPNYSGPDSFTYKANDGTVDSNVATVSITVTPVNDPPIIKAIAILTTPEDTELPVCLEVSDAEGNVITYQDPTMVSGGGTMTPSTEFGFCYVFMPAKDFNGDAFWKFTVCDNGNPSKCTEVTVQIRITPVNDPPIAVDDEITAMSATNTDGVNILANDRDIENDGLVLTITPISGPYHGTITMNPNGTITYKSVLGYIGTDSVRYQVCDTGIPSLCDEGLVIIEVGPAPFKIYNGLSPNGDNRNDYWRIDGIEAFPNNKVRVFDRYNNLIFETSGYNNDDNSWRGQTNHSMVSGNVSEGTYFYSLDLGDGSGLYSGYIVLKKN